MSEAYICDAARTAIERYAGALSSVRPDDLAAIPLRALKDRNPSILGHIDDVIMGCANQAGEDNSDVALMSALLGGAWALMLPERRSTGYVVPVWMRLRWPRGPLRPEMPI